MKIHIAADHAGYNLKEQLKVFVQSLGHDVIDHGAFDENPTDDYPDFIEPVAQAISVAQASGDLSRACRGIIIGGSGQGEAMDANRFAHVRAAEYYGGDVEVVRVSREHNDANILSLGARFVTDDEAMRAVQVFLETKFSGDARHERRIEKLDD